VTLDEAIDVEDPFYEYPKSTMTSETSPVPFGTMVIEIQHGLAEDVEMEDLT
jgi:hypothetical protein